jgi:hypothetical protein
MMAVLLVLAQAVAPTVGDTIWVERVVPLPPGHLARLTDWQLEGDVEMLGEPVLSHEGNTVVVRFPLVAWRPGTHTVEVPGPELVGPDGRTVPVPTEARVLEVASVLPEGPAEEIPIREPAGIVGRPVASWMPVVMMLLVAGLLVAPAWWWWSRRGPTAADADPAEPVPIPVADWARAGEQRVVLAVATDQVRHAVAENLPEAHPGLDTEACIAIIQAAKPAWDPEPVVTVLRELDLARFRPEGPEEVLALCQKAESAALHLTGAAV